MTPSPRPIPMVQLLFCGAFIVTLSMGIRHGFGLWLQPITMARGWTREDYSLALALQNLVWGASGPFVGWWADRTGAFKVLCLGALLYAAGLIGMAASDQHLGFVLSTGATIGLAQACTTYAVIYGVIGRNIDVAQRSWAMGLTAAAGSFGQFLMVPAASLLIHGLGWAHALWALAALALLIAPLALGLKEQRTSQDVVHAHPPANGEVQAAVHAGAADTRQALGEALAHPDYLLLTAGYFVCGFQLAFIGVHLPSYLRDHQLSPQLATTALALIGLFNILGSYSVGILGSRWPKNHLLSGIYFTRALAMMAFVLAPLTDWSVSLFAALMGLLWLSTVPLTNAIVAQMLGVQHLSMLGGIVFFSHQIGSFLGVWLAGRLYDFQGSYRLVWWLAIALGILAGLLNLPIREHRHPAARQLAAP